MSSSPIDSQLFDAAKAGNAARVQEILDAAPDKLHARAEPYEWSLLHVAAENGQLAVVDMLLERGLDANVREKGDNTYPMHWAAAAGHSDVVRLLADAGGDVIGAGDDHELEVIGWTTCWNGCDDDVHREIASFLLSRGARHHIFSATAMRRSNEVRRIVAVDSSALEKPMSHNENHQRPLHFAVRMNLAEMVALLVELGADPLGVDASGGTPSMYATVPDVDRPILEKIHELGKGDLLIAVALHDWNAAKTMIRKRDEVERTGALHLMAKRNDGAAVEWLLSKGADPNALWDHWGARVTPLHLASLHGHASVVRQLLGVGADPRIHDSMHDSEPIGWAEVAGRAEVVEILKEATTRL